MDTGGDICSTHQLSIQTQSMSSSKKILIRIPREIPFQDCMHFFPLIFNQEIDLESKAWVEANGKLSFTQKDCILSQQITFHPPDDNEFSPEGIGCSLLAGMIFFHPVWTDLGESCLFVIVFLSLGFIFFYILLQLLVSQLNRSKRPGKGIGEIILSLKLCHWNYGHNALKGGSSKDQEQCKDNRDPVGRKMKSSSFYIPVFLNLGSFKMYIIQLP